MKLQCKEKNGRHDEIKNVKRSKNAKAKKKTKEINKLIYSKAIKKISLLANDDTGFGFLYATKAYTRIIGFSFLCFTTVDHTVLKEFEYICVRILFFLVSTGRQMCVVFSEKMCLKKNR
jgi:hypothetical protein